MIYDTKTISCTIRGTYYAKTTWISWKPKRSSVDSYGTKKKTKQKQKQKHCVKLLHYYTYAMQAYSLKYPIISSISPQISRIPIIFHLNIPYPDNPL